jgi:ATP-binding cassette subfamily F protein uup
VTSTIVFEAGGHVQEYVGGYEDWLRQRDNRTRDGAPSRGVRIQADRGVRLQADQGRKGRLKPSAISGPTAAITIKKLSYKEQRELDALPGRIEALEAEQRDLSARIAGRDFYKSPRADIDAALARVDPLAQQLAEAYSRWHDLESRKP